MEQRGGREGEGEKEGGKRSHRIRSPPTQSDQPGSHVLVIVKYLLAELIDQLVKTQVHLRLNLVIQELPAKVVQGVLRTVAVQVKRVQNVLHHVSLFVDQYVIGQNPRQ